MILAVLILLTMFLDYLYSEWRNTSFYISESLLFSTFWFLFLPLLNVLLKFSLKYRRLKVILPVSAALAIFHIFLYPFLIWLVSLLLMGHTFSYSGTLEYAVNTYFIETVIIYGFSAFLISLSGKNSINKNSESENAEPEKNPPLQNILISDSANRKMLIDVNEISYFEAFPPYINIYCGSRKYLYSDTLKSMESKLDRLKFIRVHKSFIVNLNDVVSYKSRHNGDYDLILTDGTILRLSRKYAADFKSLYQKSPRLTAE
jgi:hypothetical protein